VNDRAVYVTGMGAVSCLGRGVGELWQGLCEGRSGLAPITRFDLGGLPYATAGLVDDSLLGAAPTAGASRGARLASVACAEALEGLSADQRRDLVLVSASNFGPAEYIAAYPDAVPDTYALALGMFAEDARQVASGLGVGKGAVSLSLSCASGNAAVAHAVRLLRAGRARAALACGYDSIQPSTWAGLSCLRVMCLPREPDAARVRPFDVDRSGTIFSEGAACVLLERGDAAAERGAVPLAEVAGSSANNNAHHLTHADEEGRGTALAIDMALADAAMEPEEVDHINAHGTGTKLNDVIESRAFRLVFGERAAEIPVVSNKGGLGHSMGAASLLELAASAMTLREGLIPPTVDLETIDPECALDVVHGEVRQAAVQVVVNNAAGIGGTNAAVVLRAVR
jgi:3-oxoacyl-[acyl-carrier-protein] synthase II